VRIANLSGTRAGDSSLPGSCRPRMHRLHGENWWKSPPQSRTTVKNPSNGRRHASYRGRERILAADHAFAGHSQPSRHDDASSDPMKTRGLPTPQVFFDEAPRKLRNFDTSWRANSAIARAGVHARHLIWHAGPQRSGANAWIRQFTRGNTWRATAASPACPLTTSN
jgi:hypothetical protein